MDGRVSCWYYVGNSRPSHISESHFIYDL